MSGRCKACDRKLNEFEIVRKIKSPHTGETSYSDLCSTCLGASDLDDLYFINGKENPLLEVDDE